MGRGFSRILPAVSLNFFLSSSIVDGEAEINPSEHGKFDDCMEKTALNTELSFYDSLTPWNSEQKRFLIRGFALNERMAPMLVHHGEKTEYPWPWLIVCFEDRVTLDSGWKHESSWEKAVMIWPPGSVHRYGSLEHSWRHSWLIVEAPELGEILAEYGLPIGAPFRLDAGRIFAKYLTLLHEELMQYQPDEPFLKGVLRLFLYELHRLRRDRREQIPARVLEMKLYLAEHLDEELSVETVAARFDLSAAHFSALFRRHYHVTPMRYLNLLRMNQAARLLRFYPFSCKEVAARTGFRDPLYFSRCFRRFWGVSPQTFRAREENGGII